MPKRKRYSRTPRRTFKRRRRYYRRKKIARLPITGFPSRKLVKLKYVQQLTLDCTSAATDFHVFRLMSPYDPDYSGTGGQPTGFDQWMSVYNHYTVLGAKITVHNCGPNNTANSLPLTWGIHISSSATAISSSTTAESLMMQPNTVVKLGGAVNMGGNWKNTCVMKFSPKKFFGRKVLQDDQFKGSAASNPEEEAWATVFNCNFEGLNPSAILHIVKIEYIVMFHEKKLLLDS